MSSKKQKKCGGGRRTRIKPRPIDKDLTGKGCKEKDNTTCGNSTRRNLKKKKQKNKEKDQSLVGG